MELYNPAKLESTYDNWWTLEASSVGSISQENTRMKKLAFLTVSLLCSE